MPAFGVTFGWTTPRGPEARDSLAQDGGPGYSATKTSSESRRDDTPLSPRSEVQSAIEALKTDIVSR
jgi:hypothetical protein